LSRVLLNMTKAISLLLLIAARISMSLIIIRIITTISHQDLEQMKMSNQKKVFLSHLPMLEVRKAQEKVYNS